MSEARKGHSAAPQAGTLRRRAERRLRSKKTRPVEAVPEAEVRALVHELQVHQIELEMQNEELHRAQAAAQKYLDIAGVILLALDADGNITSLNRKGYEVLGYPQGELTARSWFETCLPERERSRVLAVFRQLMAGNIEVFGHVENSVLTRSGSERIIAWHNAPLFDETGTVVGTLSSGEEITERKQAGEALPESEARYRSLFDDSPIPLWEADCSEVKGYIDDLRRSGVTDFKAYFEKDRSAVVDCVSRVRILDLNRAAVSLYKARDKQELLSNLHAIFLEETYDAFVGALVAVAEGRTLLDFETAVCTLQGERRYLSCRCAVAPGYDRTLAKVFVSSIDITQRKQAEESIKKWVDAQTAELAATNQRLQREIQERRQAEERLQKRQTELAHLSRVKTMGEMANGLAHELNQPLAAILMRAEVTAKKLRVGKRMPQQELLAVLDFIADETHRGGEIIRRIRQFVRKTEPETTAVDPAEVISEVLPLVENDLVHAGITLAVNVPPALPKVLADKIQIQQVLLNLLRNAAEAMESTSAGAPGLTVAAEPRGKLLAISVSDTGCGIPEDRMAKLFGTFSSTKPGGMGLGLVISRSIVEAHGGKIWAQRNGERGTTFTFSLPIAAEQE